MNEKKERSLRRKAIRLWLREWTGREILKRIPRSRAWLHKWQRRFTQLGWAGLKSHSRRPCHLSRRYPPSTRRAIRQARQRLVKRQVGLIGPKAIQDELRMAKLLRRLPSISTIQRILHEEGLIKKPCPAANVYFPQPTPTDHYVLQAMDWTARYLSGGPKVFAFHTTDLQTRAIQQTISTDKSGVTVHHHVLRVWQTLGLPDGVQMDNDAAFCGGYKTPRIFGEFVRLCLYLGIEPIFLPVHEPKRNSVVERLNGLWSQAFWNRHHFRSVSHVKRASPKFLAWYMQHYCPSALDGLTPSQAYQPLKRLTPSDLRSLPAPLPITAGRLHFIRLVAEDGSVSLLNETWPVDKRLAGHYVWATIVTHRRQLQIYYRHCAQASVRLVKVFRYKIHEPVARLLPKFRRRGRRRKMFTMC